MTNKLWINELDKGQFLPGNHFLASGKISAMENDELVNYWDAKVVAEPFILLPSKDCSKLVFAYFHTEIDAGIGINKDAKKALGLPDDFKSDGAHWFIVPIPLVESGSGKFTKYPSLVGQILTKYMEMEVPYMVQINWGAPALSCKALLAGKHVGGKFDGEELSERETSMLLGSMLEMARSTVIPPDLEAVKAFCLEQKIPGTWASSKGETLEDRIKYRLEWVKSAENMALLAQFVEATELELPIALQTLLS